MEDDFKMALKEYIKKPLKEKKKRQVYMELPIEINAQFDSMIKDLKKKGLIHINKNDLMEIAIKHLIKSLELEYPLS